MQTARYMQKSGSPVALANRRALPRIQAERGPSEPQARPPHPRASCRAARRAGSGPRCMQTAGWSAEMRFLAAAPINPNPQNPKP